MKNNYTTILQADIKKIIITTIFIIVITLLETTNSKAALQANPTTHKSPVSKYGAQWITQIRQMETTGQTMGLDETLDGVNAKEENGIDVHMMLPTEYGAVAILSASGYGNLGKLRDETDAQKRTTTGNSTGVYFTGDRWEILSMGSSNPDANPHWLTSSEVESFRGAFPSWHDGSSAFKDHGNSQWGGSLRDPRVPYAGRNGVFSMYTTCSRVTNIWSVDPWNNNRWVSHNDYWSYGVPGSGWANAVSRGAATCT